MYSLTDEGRRYLENGLPEENLMAVLKRPLPISEICKRTDNFDIALSWAKKKGWAKTEGGNIIPLSHPKEIPEREALGKIAEGKEIGEEMARLLLTRGLIKVEDSETYKKAMQLAGKEVAAIPSELIKTGLWRKAKLRPYNISLIGEKLYHGKPHILTHYKEKVRNIFLDLGFSEATGPLIESGFWNFDALFQPQDHPARDLADTFYMSVPKVAQLPDKSIVKKVAQAHENGGAAGSTGWQYKWEEEPAKQAVLRTHNTAVSARMLLRVKPPAKVFCIGPVFRNETISYKSLTQFTQIEGIVADSSVTFPDLLGYLKEFYSRMGFPKVRFRPAYFPYTEMSVEPEVYFEEKGMWLELGGAGIFRPEVTQPLGIDVPVLAWGLGLERLVMLRAGMDDIRNFYYRNDLKMLREAVLWP